MKSMSPLSLVGSLVIMLESTCLVIRGKGAIYRATPMQE